MLSKKITALTACIIAVISFQFILGAEDASFELGVQFERRTSAVTRATSLISVFKGMERSRMGIMPQYLKDVELSQEAVSLLIDEQILFFVMSEAALTGTKLSAEMQSRLKESTLLERPLLQRVVDFRIDHPSLNPAVHKALNKIIDDLRPAPDDP